MKPTREKTGQTLFTVSDWFVTAVGTSIIMYQNQYTWHHTLFTILLH